MRFLIPVMFLALSNLAVAECPDVSAKTIANALEVRYSCDILDLVSGRVLLGAGTRVYVDPVTKVARITTVQGYPPFDETTRSVMKKDEYTTGSQRYTATEPGNELSFTLPEGIEDHGTLVQKSSDGTVSAYNCSKK